MTVESLFINEWFRMLSAGLAEGIGNYGSNRTCHVLGGATSVLKWTNLYL